MAKRTTDNDLVAVRIKPGSIVDIVDVDEHQIVAGTPLELPRDEAKRLVAQSDHLTLEA